MPTPSGVVWMEAVPAQFSGTDSMGPVSGYTSVQFPVVDVLPALSDAIVNINANVSFFGQGFSTNLDDFSRLWSAEQFSSVSRVVGEAETRLAGGNFPSLREWILQDWVQQSWPVVKAYIDLQTESVKGAVATQSQTIQGLLKVYRDYLELHLDAIQGRVDEVQSTCNAILQAVGGLPGIIDDAKNNVRAETRRLAGNLAQHSARLARKVLEDLAGGRLLLSGNRWSAQVSWSTQDGVTEEFEAEAFGGRPAVDVSGDFCRLRGGRVVRLGPFWPEGDQEHSPEDVLWLSEELRRVLTFPWRSGAVR